jgi:hypothetical protein
MKTTKKVPMKKDSKKAMPATKKSMPPMKKGMMPMKGSY